MTGTRTETIPLVDETQLRLTIGEPEGAVRGGVVVLHESRGVTSRTQAIVEALAGEGWLAVAPHLYHRDDPGIDEQTGEDEAVDRAVAAITGESVLADSDAAFGVLADRGVSSDRMAVLGFDLGATAALVVAAQRSLGAVARSLRRAGRPRRPRRRRPAPRGRPRLRPRRRRRRLPLARAPFRRRRARRGPARSPRRGELGGGDQDGGAQPGPELVGRALALKSA
jgi:dienelactone hydrolase